MRLFLSLCRIFEVLGKADQSKPLPYNLDVAYHRSVFGKSRLKKAEEQITLQEEYEESETAKIDKIKRERETAEQEKAAAEVCVLVSIVFRYDLISNIKYINRLLVWKNTGSNRKNWLRCAER